MSFENSLWGATKIHGELLKLGIAVAQSTVSIYMVPRRDRPLQTWETFLRNHMEGIASIDLFVVPTIAFQQLFAFLVLGHKRRQLLWFAVTRSPTAEWLARQITEAFPWDTAPKYLIRDNDRAFGTVFKARVRAMGIRDRPTSFRSPWQNGMARGFGVFPGLSRSIRSPLVRFFGAYRSNLFRPEAPRRAAAGSETGLLFDFDDVPPNCFHVLANGAVVGRIMRVIQYRRATARRRMV
jgi:hypothetical protein